MPWYRNPRGGYLLALVAWLSVCWGTAWGADSVRTAKGSTNGEITAISAREITLRRTDGKEEVFPVNEIRAVRFDDEPPKLNAARGAAAGGRHAEALTSLDEMDPQAIERPELRAELAYYRVLCQGRLALAGQGSAREAGKAVRAFVEAQANSYHYYEAVELLGDLFAAVGAYDNAVAEYAKIEQAPGPEARLRAGVGRGRVLRAQGRFAEALSAFDGVLALATDGENLAVAAQRLEAELGKAECLAADGHVDDAVHLVEEVIAHAAPEEAGLHARAYATLGQCLRKAGRNQEALLAFLHVDLLYFADAPAHAKALENLVELWTALGHPERAAEALEQLKTARANQAQP